MPDNQDPKQTNQEPENTVSKEEYDKAIKQHEAVVAGLKKDLDAKKMELLDPEYLNWKESKAKKPEPPAPKAKEGSNDVDTRIAQMESTIKSLEERLNVTHQVAEQLYFDKELEITKREYPDFDDYKEDIKSILQATKDPMSYKQAYLLAKDNASRNKKEGDKGEDKKPKAPASREKPSSSVQAKALEKKDFETQEEADAATIAELKEKYPDLGDTI